MPAWFRSSSLLFPCASWPAPPALRWDRTASSNDDRTRIISHMIGRLPAHPVAAISNAGLPPRIRLATSPPLIFGMPIAGLATSRDSRSAAIEPSAPPYAGSTRPPASGTITARQSTASRLSSTRRSAGVPHPTVRDRRRRSVARMRFPIAPPSCIHQRVAWSFTAILCLRRWIRLRTPRNNQAIT